MTKMTALRFVVITIAAIFLLSAAQGQEKDPVEKDSRVVVRMVPMNSTGYESDLLESVGGGTIKIIPGGLLTFREERNSCLMLGGDGRMILCVNGKAVLDSNDLTGNKASEYMELSGEQYLLSGAGLRPRWKSTLKKAEGKFAGILFRSGDDREMIPGLSTTEQSRVYIPSRLANTPTEWPYNSSTDIVLESAHYGARLALGKLEFLLIRQRIVPNFGEGTKVKVLEEATPVTLVNADGSMEKVVQAGTFVYIRGAWKRQDLR